MKPARKAINIQFSIDDLPVAVIIHRQHDGKILSLNRAAKKLFAVTRLSQISYVSRLYIEKRLLSKSRLKFEGEVVRCRGGVKGRQIVVSLTRKNMTWQNEACCADFVTPMREGPSSRHEVVKSALDAFVCVDEFQVICDWNASAERIFGWKKREVLGKTLTETIVPGRHRQHHTNGFNSHVRTGSRSILNKLVEMTAMHKRGHEFPIELTVTTATQSGKKVFYSFIRDISERKKAEHRLLETEKNFNMAQAMASIGSWEMSGDSRELYWSDEFYRIHGLEPQSVKPSTRLRVSMTHPDDRKILQQAIAGAVQSGKSFSIEMRLILADGTNKWVLYQGQTEQDKLSGNRKIFGTLMDITRQKQSDQLQRYLHQSLQEFQAAIQDAKIVSRANKDGVITYVNENFTCISGYSQKELIGSNHRIFNSAYHPKSFWKEMWKTISTGKTWHGEVRNKRKDGTFYWVDTFITPFFDEKGKVREFLSIRHDITALKESKAALRKSNLNLSETLIFGRMGSAELDLQTFQLNVSKELLQLLDVDSESVEMPITDFLNRFVLPEFLEIIETKIEEGMSDLHDQKKVVDVEFEMITAKSRRIWIEAKGIFKGQTALGILHDVTEKRKTNEELFAKSRTIERMLEGITDGFFATDRQLNFTLVNPAFCALAKMPRQEIIGKNIAKLFPFMEGTRLISRCRQAIHKGKSEMIIYKNPDQAGQVFQISMYPNQDGLLIHYKDISQSVKAQQENQKLAMIANNTNNIVIFTDTLGRITWVNKGFERVTEYSMEEASGKKPGELLQGPDTNRDTIKRMSESIKTGQGFRHEVLNYSKSGKPYWLDIEVMPLKNTKGEVTGFMAIQSDITSLKFAIQEMQRIEQTLQAFMDYAPLHAFSKDLKGRYTFFNQAYKKFMGKKLRSGFTDLDVFEQKQAELSLVRDQHVISTGEKLQFEHRINSRTFLEYRFPLKDLYSKIFAVGGISVDITEKIEAQVTISENEERLRNLTDNLPRGFVFRYIVDAGGVIHSFPYASSGSLNLLGYSPDELRENPKIVFQLVDEEMLPLLRQASEFSRQTLNTFDLEYRIISRKGEKKWVQTRTKPRALPGGFTEWGGITLDITERKRAEEATIKANELFSLVTKATNDVIWDWNLATNEVWWNDNYYHLFGFDRHTSRSDINGWLRNIHRDDAERVQTGIKKVLDGDEMVWADEYRYLTPEGKEFFIYDRGFIMHDQNGKPYRMIGSMQDITERKLSEEKMMRNWQTYEHLFENNPLPLWIYDVKTFKFVQVNDTAVKKYGYSKEEFAQMTIHDIRTPEERERLTKILEAGQWQDNHSSGWRHQRKDGTVMEVEVYSHALYHQGRNCRFVIASDVTEQKKIQAELVESEQRFNAFMRHTPVSSWICDQSGGVKFTNESFNRTFSPDITQAKEQRDSKYPADNSKPFLHNVNAIAATGRVTETIEFATKNDGSLGEFLVYKFPMGRDLIGGVAADITEQRKSENKLRESELRFRTMANTAPVLIWMSDTDKLCNYFNKGWLDFTGRTLEQEMGNGWAEGVYPEDLDRCLKIYTSSFDLRKEFSMEYRLRRKDGEYRWIVDNGAPRFLPDGQFIGYIGSCFDIHDRKESEAAMLASNREKDLLIKEIHHRVKNNLQLISSILYIRMSGMKDSENKSFLKDMRQKIKSISLIHERLLQSGSVNQVDIADYLGKLLMDLQMSNSHPGLQLLFDTYIEPGQIGLDNAIYCGLIVNEIITNSIKHSFANRSHGLIKVIMRKDNGVNKLLICDDGSPIPDEVDLGKGASYVMQLLDILIKQLGGTAELNRENGSSFIINFK